MFISVLGICVLSKRALDVDIPHRVLTQKTAETNIRAFVMTDDASYLAGKPIDEILYPHPDRLVQILRNKNLQKVLPASVRWPLPIATNATQFTKEVDCPPFRNCIEVGRASPSFQSEPVSTDFPAIQFQIIGSHAKIEVRRNSELIKQIGVSDPSSWRTVEVRIRQNATLAASVNSGKDWAALTEPCELGILSFWTSRVLAIGGMIAGCGCLLAALGFVVILNGQEFNGLENRERQLQRSQDANKFSR
jgi:hypothetical protein